MKIAFINIYQNKVFRGAETFVAELSKRLSKKHKVEVLTSANLFRICKEKYDVVIPTNGRFQAFIVRIVTWLYGGKMIISGQSGIGFDDRLNLYSFPDFFIALTEFQLKWAKKINPFIKIVKIPNGVDLNRFTFKGEPFKGGGKVVLAVGAFTKEKRHELTINAVSKLSNVKLLIAGGGGDKKKEINDYGLKILGKDRFEILSVPFEKMPEVYRKADLLAFPTVPWESFGIAMLEAMATNLPVVASNDPIRKEIVGNAGILVNPKNTDSFASSIKKALATKWGNKPRAQAEKFNWDKIAFEYEKLLKRIK